MQHGDLFGEDNNDGDIVFRDIITLALCGFVSMVVMIMPHLNPPAKAAAVEVTFRARQCDRRDPLARRP